MLHMSERDLHSADSHPQSAAVHGAMGDARLVDEVRRGDRDAFGQLVNRYERRLMSVILRFVRDYELARDLMQETFLRAYERLDQFDPARRFGPWLLRIGVNLTLDYLRKRKRRGWTSLFTDSAIEKPPDPAVPDPRAALDLEQEVAKVLEAIPEKYRTVLVLRDLENFSTSEIAAITNRKEATIRWRLAEARNRFQKLWVQRQSATPDGDGSTLDAENISRKSLSSGHFHDDQDRDDQNEFDAGGQTDEL